MLGAFQPEEEIAFGLGKQITLHGNAETMNLSSLVFQNALESHYWRNELGKVDDLNQILQHIEKYVKHLDAWEKSSRSQSSERMHGGVRGVSRGGLISSAFCILVKIHQLHITMSDLYELAKFKRNVYVQCIALIYARHVLQPTELFKFFRHFIMCDDVVTVSNDGRRKMSVREIVRELLLEERWFDQILPRISRKLKDELEEQIRDVIKDSKSSNKSLKESGNKHRRNGSADNKRRHRSRSRSRSPRRHKKHY
ncbi:MAG: PRP38 pre-mRNA processing factor 38 domain-containing protein B [Paramarteilia canceri]